MNTLIKRFVCLRWQQYNEKQKRHWHVVEMAGLNIARKITKHDLLFSCFILCKLSHFRAHWKRYSQHLEVLNLKHFTGQLKLKVNSVRYMLCVFDIITIKTASFSSQSMLIPVEKHQTIFSGKYLLLAIPPKHIKTHDCLIRCLNQLLTKLAALHFLKWNPWGYLASHIGT